MSIPVVLHPYISTIHVFHILHILPTILHQTLSKKIWTKSNSNLVQFGGFGDFVNSPNFELEDYLITLFNNTRRTFSRACELYIEHSI